MKKFLSVAFATVMMFVFCCAVNAAPFAVTIADSAQQAAAQVYDIAGELSQQSSLSGEGTAENPYIISSVEDWESFSEDVNENGGSAYYELACDIDFKGKTITPVGNAQHKFEGTFCGNGYTLKNFKIAANQYMGLFGYVHNASISDFYVLDFSFEELPSSIASDSSGKQKMYVSPVVAFGYANKGTTTISKIGVEGEDISLEGKIKYVYYGSVAGYCETSVGNVYITDCYTNTNVALTNTSGYGYVGGIIGSQRTGSGSRTLTKNCYTAGNLSCESYNSSYVGGIAGYLYSHGSSYSPDIGSLYAEDIDVLVSHSFSVASIYSKSTKYNSNAGRIAASCNSYAEVDKLTVMYTKDSSVTVSPASEYTVGTDAAISSFKDESFLSAKLLFDFESIWTMDDTGVSEYPVFKDKTRSYDEDTSLDCLEVTTDITLTSGDNTLVIDSINFRNGNSLYLDRGTYIIGAISGDINLTAHKNANVIVTGENKPEGYTELFIGERKNGANVRYAEIDGFQYKINEYNDKYGTVTQTDTLVEISEKANENDVVIDNSKYFFIDAQTNTAKNLSVMDKYMFNYNGYSVRQPDEKTNFTYAMRFMANVTGLSKLEENEFVIDEYGFIITLKNKLTDGKQLNFDLAVSDGTAPYVFGAAYNKAEGLDVIYEADDELISFAGVLYNLKEKHYETEIVAKTYTKVTVDGKQFVVYGEEMAESLGNLLD